MSYQSRHRIIDQPVVFVTPASSRPSLRKRLVMTFKVWRERSLADASSGAPAVGGTVATPPSP